MPASPRSIVCAALFIPLGLTGFGSTIALAQSAGASSAGAPSSSLSGATSPTPSNPAPSGGVATGRSAASPETPLEKEEQQKAAKDTQICKGC